MCLSPYRFKDKVTGELKEANCQQCPECRQLLANHFALRVKIECAKQDFVPYFVTFTINDYNYIYTPKQYKKLLINKLKLMRYYGNKFKYIMSIEKGDISGRLHSHFIFLTPHNKLQTYNLLKSFYNLGFIKITEARYKDIHYVVSYLYDGVVYRTFSKGLGKPVNDEEIFRLFIKLPYSEIPLYFRRLVQKKNEGLYNRKLSQYIWSDEYTELKRKTKSAEYKNKKLDKLMQINYALKNYKKPTYKVDSVTGRRLT